MRLRSIDQFNCWWEIWLDSMLLRNKPLGLRMLGRLNDSAPAGNVVEWGQCRHWGRESPHCFLSSVAGRVVECVPACVCQGRLETWMPPRTVGTAASRARTRCCSPGTASRRCWSSGCRPSRAARTTAARPWASASRPCLSRITSRRGATRWSRANQSYLRPCWPASQVRECATPGVRSPPRALPGTAVFTEGVSGRSSLPLHPTFDLWGILRLQTSCI